MYAANALAPPRLFAPADGAPIWAENEALLICHGLARGVKPWACCVSIEYQTVGLAEGAGGGGGRWRRRGGGAGVGGGHGGGGHGGGGHGGGGGIGVGDHKQKQAEVVRRWRLPSTEALHETFSCAVPTAAAARGAREAGELHATTYFLCWGAAKDHREQPPLPWSEVAQLHSQSNALLGQGGTTIEVELTKGRGRLAFGGFEKGVDAYRALKREHARAIADLSRRACDANWLPLSIHLLPPLTLTNLLPCDVRVIVRPLALSKKELAQRGWSLEGAPPAEAAGGGGGGGGGAATHREVAALDARIEAGGTAESHEWATLGPIEMIVELVRPLGGGGGGAGAAGAAGAGGAGTKVASPPPHQPHDGRRGTLLLDTASKRPRLGGAGGAPPQMDREMILRPTDAHPAPSCSHPLRVHATLRAGHAGALSVTLSCKHWLRNNSSLPLRLYDASGVAADVEPVAEAAAHLPGGAPFSLADADKGRCRVGVAPSHLGGAPAAARQHKPNLFRHGREIHAGLLSRPFSAASSHDEGSLEVVVPHPTRPDAPGHVAELVVQLSAADGPLERSGATVVAISDRFVLHNRTNAHLEWCQPGAPPVAAAADPAPSSSANVVVGGGGGGGGARRPRRRAAPRPRRLATRRSIRCRRGRTRPCGGPSAAAAAAAAPRAATRRRGASRSDAARGGASTSGARPSTRRPSARSS